MNATLDEPLATREQSAIIIGVIVLGLVIVFVGILLLVDFRFHLPDIPKQQSGVSIDDFKKQVDNYKDLTAALQANSKSMYELLMSPMTSLFTSVIAAVLTFVFAKTALRVALAWRQARVSDKRDERAD